MGGPGDFYDMVPDGDYEDKDFRSLAQAAFKGEITYAEWKQIALALAEQRTEPWGVKYPLHAEFMPLIIQTFPKAFWIWCQRDVLDTWQSWLRNFNNVTPESAWARIHYRHWAIALALLDRPHIEVDMTRRQDEEELAKALGEGIDMLAPGTLQEWASSTP